MTEREWERERRSQAMEHERRSMMDSLRRAREEREARRPPLTIERMTGGAPPAPWWVFLKIAAWCWASFHIAFDVRAVVEWLAK